MTDIVGAMEIRQALAATRTTSEFVRACTEYAERSPHVKLNEDALESLVEETRRGSAIFWDGYLRNPSGPIEDSVFDTTFNAALNGGYFQVGEGGDVVQWQQGGSGSNALLNWIQGLVRDHQLPGVDLLTPEAAAAAITPRVMGLPLARERVHICEQFADQIRLAKLEALISNSCAAGRYTFGLPEARALAAIYPAAFAADPFLKKAILALQMLTQCLVSSRRMEVAYDLPIPSDYQIPRYLAFRGALLPSPEAISEIASGRLLDVEGDVVTAMRAGAVSLSHKLGIAAGVPDYIVDGVLFTACRGDPEVKARALPPMRCSSLWF